MTSKKFTPTPRNENFLSQKKGCARVLAFDPGFERLGVAVLERAAASPTLLYSACVRTKMGRPFSERLHDIGSAARELIEKFSPDTVALERIFFAKNEKTAMHI